MGGEHFGQRSLAAADISSYRYMHEIKIFTKVLIFI